MDDLKKKMKKEEKRNTIIFSALFILVMLFIYLNYQGGLKEKEIYKIVDRKWSIDGTIIEKNTSGYISNRGTLIITSDGQKFIFPWARNFNYKRSMLSEFVEIGDSIKKQKDSDSIFIYRQQQVFYFVIKSKIPLEE